MLPSSVRWVGELPLRDNYKLDESALPDLPYTELLAASGEAAGDPDSETARAVLACFRRVLDGTPVTVDDNFFLLGGDSVGAAEVVMHVNEQFGEVLGVADFFREPTVRYVVDQIEQRHAAV
jgi:acyl carrier protein